MPDISMCRNEECPLKLKCYRYTAIPSEFMQSYTSFKPIIVDKSVKCSAFWSNKNMKQPKNKKRNDK